MPEEITRQIYFQVPELFEELWDFSPHNPFFGPYLEGACA